MNEKENERIYTKEDLRAIMSDSHSMPDFDKTLKDMVLLYNIQQLLSNIVAPAVISLIVSGAVCLFFKKMNGSD